MKPAHFAIAAAALLALDGCGRPSAAAAPPPPTSTVASHASQPASGKPRRLVFFMNPGGRPCQIQDQILQAMGPTLQAQAEVVYFRTTEPADLPRFEQYGVRSLPLLLVTDRDGVELRRATPGIQSEAQVLSLLAR